MGKCVWLTVVVVGMTGLCASARAQEATATPIPWAISQVTMEVANASTPQGLHVKIRRNAATMSTGDEPEIRVACRVVEMPAQTTVFSSSNCANNNLWSWTSPGIRSPDIDAFLRWTEPGFEFVGAYVPLFKMNLFEKKKYRWSVSLQQKDMTGLFKTIDSSVGDFSPNVIHRYPVATKGVFFEAIKVSTFEGSGLSIEPILVNRAPSSIAFQGMIRCRVTQGTSELMNAVTGGTYRMDPEGTKKVGGLSTSWTGTIRRGVSYGYHCLLTDSQDASVTGKVIVELRGTFVGVADRSVSF